MNYDEIVKLLKDDTEKIRDTHPRVAMGVIRAIGMIKEEKAREPINTIFKSIMNIEDRKLKLDCLTYQNDRGAVSVSEDVTKEILVGIESEKKSDKHKLELFKFSREASMAIIVMIASQIDRDEYEEIGKRLLEESEIKKDYVIDKCT